MVHQPDFNLDAERRNAIIPFREPVAAPLASPLEDGSDFPPNPDSRAAQYVRMSTDHEEYSTANQRDAIAAYAAKHGLEIVRTYADEGRSGLQVKVATGSAHCCGMSSTGRPASESCSSTT